MGPTKGGENRNGEERIRDANKPKSKRMGTIGGCISHKVNEPGVKTVIVRKAQCVLLTQILQKHMEMFL